MPSIYENKGHMKSCIANYHRMVWKVQAWKESELCRACGKQMHNRFDGTEWQDKATVDHKIARAIGGTDTEENFELICGKCNNKKSKLETKIKDAMDRGLCVKLMVDNLGYPLYK